MNIESFTKLLQLSISPIALISGAGLLMLSITNRLSRSIDRSRLLALDLDKGGAHHAANVSQLETLIRRSEFLRNSVFFTGMSIFFSTVMILGLAVLMFVGWTVEAPVVIFLFLSMASLCVSLIYFLLDVSLALKALKIELGKYL